MNASPLPAPKPSARGRCRTNSRHGLTDPGHRSYPPVKSVCRALDVLYNLKRGRTFGRIDGDIQKLTAQP